MAYSCRPRVLWETVAGCSAVSAGCANCYAARAMATWNRNEPNRGGLAVLNPGGAPKWTGDVRLIRQRFPLSPDNEPAMVYCNLMADTFHERVPFEHVDWIVDTAERNPRHVFQILTRRAERMGDYCASRAAPLPHNLWMGVSIETRDYLWRAERLRGCGAAVRFISLEPLLEDLGGVNLNGIGLVMVGLECGPGARHGEHDWVRGVVAQCRAASVPVMVEQLRGIDDSRQHWPHDLRCDEWPEEVSV